MISFFAQVTPASEAIERFEEIWLLVGVAFPFLFPFVIKAGAQRWVKLALSLGLSTFVAFLTLLPQLPSMDALTAEAALGWTAMFIGVVQTVYQVADHAVEAAAYGQGGLNWAKVYKPWIGAGREETITAGER